MTHEQVVNLLLYLWDALVFCWIATGLMAKQTRRAEPHWRAITRSVVLGAMLYVLFEAPPHWYPLHVRIIPQGPGEDLLGLCIMLIGTAFAIWARFALGNNWSSRATIKQDHELIIRGPYRIVRNPIYTGLFFALAGTCIVLGEVRHLLALPILLIVWATKIHTEQRFLREQFGDPYLQYCREVKAFLPYVI